MEEQFKEIEGLLETTQTQIHQTPAAKFKKYVRLVFPHVALVTVVCIYAMIGAYIFYRLESPNEDRLKTIGRSSILDMRSHLISIIRAGELNKDEWKDQVEDELLRFNDKIYKSFKEQYVRYADVRLAALPDSSEEKDDDRVKRHRGSKSRSEKGEKLWTASSALFFAATTMATIGYGNIVPATSSGRIACVVFALFGAPLAIITIGDLGKFLSECTIWLYKQMKKGRVSMRARWKQMRGTGKCNLDDCEEQSEKSSKSQLDWEDLVMDKTEVPVLMVFTILLLYIAFGGILFSFLEGWTYMDAFYYSFISLTTIGFGDIVPENHDYIVLMLIYLGVGLAVTTMCIDLVGIQYIQKIHYFGRKFRGTDILHLLKRRRMIERRLAMGHGDELLQMYIQQIQKEMEEEPDESEDEEVPEEMEPLKELSLKAPSPDWQIDDALVSSRYSYKFPCSERIPSPNVLSIRSFRTPSIYSNSSASARSMMMSRYHCRGGSWDESGPSLSDHCSLSTEPSVHQRQDYWDNFTSPQPSITSFKFEFPPPSPDYHAIAADARRSRRLCSCPNSSFSFPSHSNSPVGLACMEDWDSYIRMLEEYEKPCESFGNESEDSTIDFPVQVNALPAGNMNMDEDGEVLMHYGDSNEPIPVFSVDEMPLDGPTTLTNTLRCPVKYISKVPPSLVVDNFCFICDGDEVKVDEILFDQKWWKQTSSSTRFYSSDNLTTFNQVTLLTCRGEMRGAYRSRSRGGGLVKVHLDQVFRVSRYFSSWRTCHAFHRIVSVINPVTKEGEHINNFKKRIFVQYFWREEKPADRARVAREYMEGRMKLSPRNSLAVPSVSHSSRSWFPLSNTSYSSLNSHDSISPRTSANLREDSKWRVLGRMYRRGVRKPFNRTDTTASLPHNGNTKRLSLNSLPDPYPQSHL